MCRFLFRCDVSSQAGIGHLRRCMVIANELKNMGSFVSFLCRTMHFNDFRETISSFDKIKTMDWSFSPEDDTQEVVNLFKRWKINIVVIDHYRASLEYQRRLYDSGVKWVQFDGCKENKLLANWVINSSPAAKNCDYWSLRQNDKTCFLLGPEFAPLRSEFYQLKTKVEFRKRVKRILLTFGGGDDRGAILFCLKAIKNLYSNIERVVLTTSDNPSNDEIAYWMKINRVKTELVVDEPEIARRMAEADLGITAGGMTTFETAAMGLPCLIVQIADNQTLNAKAWHEAGVSINLGSLDELKQEDLCQQVKRLIEQPEQRKNMHETGRSMVDCRGAERVARVLLGESD